MTDRRAPADLDSGATGTIAAHSRPSSADAPLGDGQGEGVVRLVARHVSELLLERGMRWQAALGVNRLDCLVLQLVLSAGLAHQPYREQGHLVGWKGLRSQVDHARATSVLAVSRSMELPYETVRRRIAEQQRLGRLAAAPGGFTVDGEFQRMLWAGDLIQREVDGLHTMLGALAADGYAPAEAIGVHALDVPCDVQARLLLDFAMRCFESFMEQYGDIVAGSVSVAIVAANVRHLLGDRALSRRYAAESTPPPDAQRRPVSVRALARDLDMPFETVRRQVVKQVASGWVEERDGGVVVPTRVLLEERYRRNNRAVLRHLERLIRDLARL